MSRHLQKLTGLKQRIVSFARLCVGRLRWRKDKSNRSVQKDEDRHECREQEKTGSESGKKRSLPAFFRKYLFLAGTYLVTVVLLLSFVIWRLGALQQEEMEKPTPPSAVLEGWPAATEREREEKETESEKQTGETAEEYTRDFLEDFEEDIGLPQEESTAVPEHPGEEEEKNLLSHPASPLPGWSIHTSYGSYIHSVLSTGSQIHGTARGAVLQGTPAAPVSAIWDGEVVQTSGQAGSGRCSVTIQHDHGYLTFYSRLNEVWVETGQHISRGEHIGLLPEAPTKRKSVMSRAEEEDNTRTGSETATIQTEDVRQLEPYEVQVYTVYSGYPEQEGSATAPVGDTASASFPPAFQDESPLLYLEISYRNINLDPVDLLLERN